MEVDLDSMEVLNSVRYEISRLSKDSRFECESLVGEQLENCGIWDEDYLSYFRGVLGKPVKELEDDEDVCFIELSDDDLNGDDQLENSVAKSEKEGADDDDVIFVNSVAKSENEGADDDLIFVNSVAKSKNEGADDDDHFVNSVAGKENEDSGDDDAQYKIFLSHLKGNGKSFTFEIKDENGIAKIFEYQKEEPMDGWPKLKINRNMNEVAERKRKRKRSRSEPKISKKVKRNCIGSLSREKSNIPSHKHTSRIQSISRSKPKSNEEGLGKMGQEQQEKSLNVGRHVIKEEQESLVEEDYKRFLKFAGVVDGRINLPLKSDKIIVYDEQVDLGNVLRHEVTSLRPSSSGKDNVEEDDSCQILNGLFETDPLKEKVMAILRKPFDGQEYKRLWHDVTQKKYKLRHRELKDNRELSVPTEIKAKSYLEQHEDLQRQIEAVPDNKYQRLNILRGFFFWLQHAAWGVSFKPWEDASCLAVMPGSHFDWHVVD